MTVFLGYLSLAAAGWFALRAGPTFQRWMEPKSDWVRGREALGRCHERVKAGQP